MIKIYCEHSALNKTLKKMKADGQIDLIYFPYDIDSRTNKISKSAKPSGVTWENLHLRWGELNHSFNDFVVSNKFEEIKSIIGGENKNDILHVDSAYKSNCRCMITRDSDILSKSEQLEELLKLKFFHPDKDNKSIVSFIKNNT